VFLVALIIVRAKQTTYARSAVGTHTLHGGSTPPISKTKISMMIWRFLCLADGVSQLLGLLFERLALAFLPLALFDDCAFVKLLSSAANRKLELNSIVGSIHFDWD